MALNQHNNDARKPFRQQVIQANNLGTHTCTGSVTLTKRTAQNMMIDPGGASRDVMLPAVENGLFFSIVNTADANESLVVKNAGGSTIGTVGQGECGEFWSDGSAWTMLRRWTVLASGIGAPRVATGTIPFASVRTLFATPYTVIPAPGAGLYNEVHRCHWWLDYSGVAYDAAAVGDTLSLHYTNGAGAALVDAIAGNAIGAATADYHTMALAVPEVIPVANAAVVAALQAGEWYSAAGTSPLKYQIDYTVRTLDFV